MARVALQKLTVYHLLMDGEEVDTADSDRSLVSAAMATSPSASFLLGQELIHEVQEGPAKKEALVFWACSVCYVAAATAAEAVEHLASPQHRLYYIKQYHEALTPSGSTQDIVRSELLRVSKELRAKNKDLKPEIMILKAGVDKKALMGKLGIKAQAAVLNKAAAAAAAAVIKSTAEHTLLYCDECWVTLVIDLRASSVETVWAKHILSQPHLNKVNIRKSLAIGIHLLSLPFHQQVTKEQEKHIWQMRST